MTIGLEIKLGHDKGGKLEGFWLTQRFFGRLFLLDEFDDTLIGGKGADSLYGHGGDDMLIGGAGADLLFGGQGNDTLLGGGDHGDTLAGGSGEDWVDYSRHRTAGNADRTPIEIDLDAQLVWIGPGQGNPAGPFINHLRSIEHAIGSAGNDTILGSKGDNQLEGRGGDDLLEGSAGADTLHGGPGADTLLGGDDADVASYEAAAGPVMVSLLRGVAETRLAGGVERDVLRDIEGVIGSQLGDTLIGAATDDVLAGRGGRDTLVGFAGEDRLYGEDGNDALSGGDDNDSLMGGEGRDLLLGNDGDDLIFGEDDDDVLRGGDGADTLAGGEGRDRLTGGLEGDAFGYLAIADSMFGLEDEITDFDARDRLDIMEVIQELLPEPALRANFLAFIGEKAFTKGGVFELRYDAAVGRLELDVNNSGAYDAGDFGVQLPKQLTLALDGMTFAIGRELVRLDQVRDGVALAEGAAPTGPAVSAESDPWLVAASDEPAWHDVWPDEAAWHVDWPEDTALPSYEPAGSGGAGDDEDAVLVWALPEAGRDEALRLPGESLADVAGAATAVVSPPQDAWADLLWHPEDGIGDETVTASPSLDQGDIMVTGPQDSLSGGDHVALEPDTLAGWLPMPDAVYLAASKTVWEEALIA